MSGPEQRAGIEARIASAREELAEARAQLPAFDEEHFRQRVTEMLAESRDPALYDDVWDYREGRIDRQELRRRPAFRAAHQARMRALRARIEEGGHRG